MDDADDRFLLRGIPYHVYCALRDAVDEVNGKVWMTYDVGVLELMSPSPRHDIIKKVLARLLEAWSEELDVDLRGLGSTTFRDPATERGLEADECYTLGGLPDFEPGGVPALAIEVVASSPLLDKLEVYASLGVGEVWVWNVKRPGIHVHVVLEGRLVAVERSHL